MTDETAFNQKTHEEGRTLLRVATELRAFLADAPTDDPEAQSLRRDCDTLDRVGQWLSTSNAVTIATTGVPAAAVPRGTSQPSQRSQT